MTQGLTRPRADAHTGIDASLVKRRVYLAYFAFVVVGASALGLALPVLDPSIAVVAVAIVPPTLLFFGLCLVTLAIRPGLLRLIEVAQYFAYYPILIGLLSLMLSNAAPEAGNLQAIASFSMWVPVVAVWAFIVFGSHGGPYAALTFVAAAGVVLAVHYRGAETLGPASTVYLVQAVVAHIGFVVILYALSRLLEAQTARRVATEAAAEYAVKDALTGLFTRYAFDVRFEQALALARRTTRPLAVYFLDVDDFKRVNDDLGHAAGDDLLRELAARIKAAVRDADTVARLGGDEFVVLAFVEDARHTESLAARLVAVGDEPMLCNGLEVTVAISVGVSLFPDDAEAADALLAAADAAMYAAKAQGKRRWAHASSAHPPPA